MTGASRLATWSGGEVNFVPHPVTSSAAEAHLTAPYAAPIAPNLWLPFETYNPQWAKERFAELSYDAPSQTVPAVIVSEGAPVVGERFTVGLSDATHSAGFTKRTAWRWERGSDATGWRPAYGVCGRSYHYVPYANDVGLHLRAYVYYTDPAGIRVKAMTPASAPVTAK